MEALWDDRHGLPVNKYADRGHIALDSTMRTRFTIVPDHNDRLPLEALYEPSASSTLIVSMHGAVQRSKVDLPRFEWQRTLQRLEAGKLFLADSTLLLGSSLELGWYLGTHEQDLTGELAELVQVVAKIGGYENVVCVGGSGGGFAALAVSRRIPNSLAVAFSPQTSIAGYYSLHRKRIAAAVFPTYSSFQYIEEDHAARVNLRLLYSASEETNYVYYVQNRGDPFHYAAHYAPFALSLGVHPETGGIARNGRTLFVADRYERGHAPPSRGRFVRDLRRAHHRFYKRDIQFSAESE